MVATLTCYVGEYTKEEMLRYWSVVAKATLGIPAFRCWIADSEASMILLEESHGEGHYRNNTLN